MTTTVQSIINIHLGRAALTSSCLILFPVPVSKQEVLQVQPHSQTGIGEEATLRCPLLAGAALTGSASLSWYRKRAGRSPELLLTLSSSQVRRGADVQPDKVSAAADGSLRLRRLELSDTAAYYCSVTEGAEQQKEEQ
uniref:Ig-like domain-containing protein n=1 Tax=Scophthalmus maximus TaxID=52904 RepID=A0A8D3B3Q7_SCOMX